MSLKSKLRGVYLKVFFFFRTKILFKDKFGLSYYLYKNTRPNSTYNLKVRSDDTTVLFTVDKILSSSELTNNNSIHCIDVGAYIGVVTLMMSRALRKFNKEWKIHSFEPFSESFKRLQENVYLNTFNRNVVLNNVAVSDKKGYSTLKIYHNTPGLNHLSMSQTQNSDNKSSEKKIKVITLRDYLKEEQIGHVSICKVDAEGSDYCVINGLYEYLEKKSIDFIIFEYQSDSYKKIKNILYKNGYEIFYMVRNENIIVNSIKNYPKNSKSLMNLIAVSSEKKNDFLKNFKIG